MAEVTPELQSQINEYFKKRERGEKTLLSFFYKEVFGRELKTDCGGCVEDGIEHLKTVIKKQSMKNFKWIGNEKASVVLRVHGQIYSVDKNSCTDALAEIISTIPKYAHNVVRVSGEPTLFEQQKKTTEHVKVGSAKSEVTTSTLKEAMKGEVVVKVKRGRPKLK